MWRLTLYISDLSIIFDQGTLEGTRKEAKASSITGYSSTFRRFNLHLSFSGLFIQKTEGKLWQILNENTYGALTIRPSKTKLFEGETSRTISSSSSRGGFDFPRGECCRTMEKQGKCRWTVGICHSSTRSRLEAAQREPNEENVATWLLISPSFSNFSAFRRDTSRYLRVTGRSRGAR